jgi:hypothetical protein
MTTHSFIERNEKKKECKEKENIITQAFFGLRSTTEG